MFVLWVGWWSQTTVGGAETGWRVDVKENYPEVTGGVPCNRIGTEGGICGKWGGVLKEVVCGPQR